jgi:pimeloyl-ACP methyl ester carboxylesterase
MPIPPHDEAGEGPPVLFGHGTMMDRTMFAPQLADLSDEFRAIAFDHRARTRDWRGPYSLDDLADDCVALLDRLEIERAVLGGMSMGGFMAYRFALRHPDRLAGLILIDTMAEAPRSPHEDLFGSLRDSGPLPDDVVEWHADIVFGATTKRERGDLVDAWKERWRWLRGAAVYWESKTWLRREDISPRLGEIAVPALVVHGAEEEILPLDSAERAAAAMPQGRLFKVEEAGHTANLERPDLVNPAIRSFLHEVWD